MSDFHFHITKYLPVVYASPRMVILVALFFCIPGWLMVWNLPIAYQSEARVRMVSPAPDLVMWRITDQDRDYLTQYSIDWLFDQLASVDGLKIIATDNGLLLDTHTDLEKGQILQAFKENISLKSQRVQGAGQNTLDVVLSYRDIDAERSRAVNSEILKLLLNIISKDQLPERSRKLVFLDAQIEKYPPLVKEAENALSRFRLENATFRPYQSKSGLGEGMSATSEVEDEFNKLNRNYEALRERYIDFVKRRDLAQIQHQEDIESLRIHSRVVEPPNILPNPVRPLLFALVFLGSCALGIAIPIVLYLIRSSYSEG